LASIEKAVIEKAAIEKAAIEKASSSFSSIYYEIKVGQVVLQVPCTVSNLIKDTLGSFGLLHRTTT
jgi:hypothetical protein